MIPNDGQSAPAFIGLTGELTPAYREQEAVLEANRCLYCFDAPCIRACPSGIDVPAFIRQIADGRTLAAAKTILQANILGASCARVCPTEVLCEGACVVLDREGDPIKIGRLQRFATDAAKNKGSRLIRTNAPRTGKRVAVIGSGPAGLGCAAELAKLGHEVVVFEKEALPGGLNTYGIAYYKMKPAISQAEVALVESLGVTFRCATEVGRDITVSELESQFNAIFIGIGLGDGTALRIPGENLHGVRDALDFIAELRTRDLATVQVGRRVVVVGCGNTAIDAATQAKRLGAESVTIVYRRGEADMSAYKFEYDLAKSDGVAFLFNTLPIELLGGNGDEVAGLRLVRTQAGVGNRLEPVVGSEFEIPCETVIKAVGQAKRGDSLSLLWESKLAVTKDGTVQRDSLTGATSLPHVFVGGDCANGGREVVNAVGEGKKAAFSIHHFLTGTTAPKLTQTSRLGATGGATGAGLDAPIRAHELEEIYLQSTS